MKRSSFFPGSVTVGYANGLLTDWRQNCHFLTQSNCDNQRMIHCVTRRRISGSFDMNLISMQGCAAREVHEQGGTNWQWPSRENSAGSGGELQMKVNLGFWLCRLVSHVKELWYIRQILNNCMSNCDEQARDHKSWCGNYTLKLSPVQGTKSVDIFITCTYLAMWSLLILPLDSVTMITLGWLAFPSKYPICELSIIKNTKLLQAL